MKKLFLILLLLPMFLLGTQTTLTHDIFNSPYYGWMKGDTSGVDISEASAVDSFYIYNLDVGKYTYCTLFLWGDIDSMVVYTRDAPFQAVLSSFEWDSLYETSATDTILDLDITDLGAADYADIRVESLKEASGTFYWAVNMIK